MTALERSGLGRRGPPLASIESLLSFEAKSTPRSEFGVLASDNMGGGNLTRLSDWGRMETVLSVDDFQSLTGERQSEEIFKLLAMLSPFAGEVSNLKGSIDAALGRISELDGRNRLTGNLMKSERSEKDFLPEEENDTDVPMMGNFRDPESPHSATPLLPESNNLPSKLPFFRKPTIKKLSEPDKLSIYGNFLPKQSIIDI